MYTTVQSCFFPMFTHVYSSVPNITLISLKLLIFTHVFLCLLVLTYIYLCLTIFTTADSCLPMFTTFNRACFTMFNHKARVNLGKPKFTRAFYDCICLPMFTPVYSCYICLPLFTPVYLFNTVFLCMFTNDYSCLPMCTNVYL